MGNNGKKKTTMAKLNREHRLRERRAEKEARKDERKREAVDSPGGPPIGEPHMAAFEAAAPADEFGGDTPS